MSTSASPVTTVALSNGIRSGPLLPARPSDSSGPGSGPPIKAKGPERPKRPKDSKVKRTVIALAALRAQGVSYKDGAEQLGITYRTASTYMQKAREAGWFKPITEDPADKVEHVLAGLAVDNLQAIMGETKDESEKGSSLSDRAVDTSLEVAKGVGLLKTHSAIKTDSTNIMGMALKVDVVMPTGVEGGVPAIREGSLGGAPFYDAEVLEQKETD